MGIPKIKRFFLTVFLFSTAHMLAEDPHAPEESPSITPQNHIVYLMHAGDTAKALKEYRLFRAARGAHDFELIERIGLILLDQGFRSRDPETQLLTLFGAGISTNEKALYIIEDALQSNQPQLEMIALNFVSRLHHDRADQLLHRAMSSNNLLVRLEAAFALAGNKDPKAIGQIESLMAKVNPVILPLFPRLYALIDNPEAKKILRKMLANRDEQVRIAAILSIAEHGHDDFLPVIRRLATQHEPGQQEACATALGILKDESSVPRLTQLAKSSNPTVQLAALKALYLLGREEVRTAMETLAQKNDLFAITALGEMQGSEEVLAKLVVDSNIHVKINAALALLELGDPRCLQTIALILLKDVPDLAVLRLSSVGKSLHAWRAIPSAKQNLEDNEVAFEMSLHLREAALVKSVELPEREFLSLANTILESQQNDLVPVLVEVLENHSTPGVIALLKKHQQKAGAPLIRNYCNLALYRLREEGPYGDNLREWVTNQRNVDMIKFRPILPWDVREKTGTTKFELNPQETSRLLVEAFEAFVSTQDDKGIDMLISIIQSGNPKNKYALIGLLMRAIQ